MVKRSECTSALAVLCPRPTRWMDQDDTEPSVEAVALAILSDVMVSWRSTHLIVYCVASNMQLEHERKAHRPFDCVTNSMQ